MRKLFLILALAGFSTMLQAGPITPEKALKVAERVLAAQPVTKAGSGLQIIWDGESAVTKAHAEDPAFYVVGRDGGGFVIVAGNDNVRPVLALSYTNRFQVEGMPCNVKAWMERIKRYSRGTMEPTPEVKAQWDAFAETKGERIEEGLEGVHFPNDTPTVEWDQGEPGNTRLPFASNDHNQQAVSGCVAVAIAEIMTWFKYPEHGEGTVEGYKSSIRVNGVNHTADIPAHTLGETTYLWDQIAELKDYESFRAVDSESPLGISIAQLIYDIGTILQLNYSADATGGGVLLAAERFSKHMGYSKSAYEISREDGHAWEWDDLLLAQVTKHPLYYSGSDPNDGSGHAYVLDGYGYYNERIVFHFNFGWDGLCNGFYSSDYQIPTEEIDPSLLITDEGFGEYHDVSALMDFEPGEGEFKPIMGYYRGGGLNVTKKTNSLDVTVTNLANIGNVPLNGVVALFYEDKDGEASEIQNSRIQTGDVPVLAVYESLVYTVPNNGGLSFGDKFYMAFKPEDSDSFSKVVSIDPESVLDEAPVYPAAFIKKEAEYHQNDYFYFRLTNHNYSYKNAVWTITDKDGVVSHCNQSESRFKLTKKGKYTIKVTPYTGAETIVTVIEVK